MAGWVKVSLQSKPRRSREVFGEKNNNKKTVKLKKPRGACASGCREDLIIVNVAEEKWRLLILIKSYITSSYNT